MKFLIATSVAAMFLGTAIIDPAAGPRSGAAMIVDADGRPASTVLAGDERAFDPGRSLRLGAAAPAIGITRPTRQAELAVPFDGVLADVAVREGAAVTRGTLLARMDDRVAAASVAAAELSAARRGAIAYAEQDLALQERRQRGLEESGAATEFELEESVFRVAQAEANLLSAQEDQRQAGRNLDYESARLDQHRVIAPFDGRIVRVFGRPGESIERREPLMLLVDLTSLDIEFNLPIDTWTTLEVGAWYALQATVPGAATPETVSARLRTAEAYVDAATQTVRCVFEIPNADRRFPAGATMSIDPQQPRIAAVPDDHGRP
ncbi:MAG: efflux RND transporter periplasmic adaptor subunit [Phycisphaerales bacterium]